MDKKRMSSVEILSIMNEVSSDNPYSNAINKMKKDIEDFEASKGHAFKDASIRILSEHTSGTIDFDTLNVVLAGLQDFSMSAYNDIYGTKTDEGKIPPEIMSQSKLILTGVSPGSFIVKFDAIENKKLFKQYNLFQELEGDAVEVLSGAIENVSKIDKAEKAIEFVETYGKRTYKQALKWVSEIKKKNVYFEYSDVYEQNLVRFDKQRVDTINKSLKSVRKEVLTRREIISGILVAVDNIKRIIIILDTHENLIKIKVKDDSLNEVDMITNNRYEFYVEIQSQISEIDSSYTNEKYFVDTVHNKN